MYRRPYSYVPPSILTEIPGIDDAIGENKSDHDVDKVIKFGGSCLTKPELLLAITEILRNEKGRVIVVTSALNGITDLLIKGICSVVESAVDIPAILEPIKRKHFLMSERCIKTENFMSDVNVRLGKKLKLLENLFHRVVEYGRADEIEARILSFGERFASLLISGILNSVGKNAVAVETDDVKLVTDDSFDNATADLSEIKKYFCPALFAILDCGVIPIITGYFGCTYDGKTTLFGRNGSDYSAAVVASVSGARVLEIWKDVDGVMNADPKKVTGTYKYDQLSYREALELFGAGVGILHPRTIEPLLNTSVDIHIKNIFKPAGEGTKITASRP